MNSYSSEKRVRIIRDEKNDKLHRVYLNVYSVYFEKWILQNKKYDLEPAVGLEYGRSVDEVEESLGKAVQIVLRPGKSYMINDGYGFLEYRERGLTVAIDGIRVIGFLFKSY